MTFVAFSGDGYLAGLWVKSGGSEGKMGAAFLVCPCLTGPSLSPNQLALDIDRDTEDQNRYLDGMVSILQPMQIPVSSVPMLSALCGWVVRGSPTSV